MAGTSCLFRTSSIRGTPTRRPNSPQASRPIALPPLPSSKHSWSQSNESATAQRASPGHADGASEEPARTREIIRRHSSSAVFQGSVLWVMANA